MNKQRRKEIEKAITLLEEAKSILEQMASDEQDYYDNMPESIQSGERGSQAEAASETLQEAAYDIDEVIERCNTAME